MSVSLFVCSECLICVLAVFATLRLSGRPGRHGCQSALWDCFGRICRSVENASPKQSHNALWNHLDPVSRATSKWRILLVQERIMEERGKGPVSLSLGTDVNSPKLFLDQLYTWVNRKLVSGEGENGYSVLSGENLTVAITIFWIFCFDTVARGINDISNIRLKSAEVRRISLPFN